MTITALLCGCPYDSPYNLDEVPLQNIDEDLLGNWSALIYRQGNKKNSKKEKQVSIIFEKRTDMDFDITITGYIEELRPWLVFNNDSIRCTAFMSTVAGKQFLNAYIHGKVYIAEVKKDSCSISILPLAEYFTSKLVKNSRELRTAVEFHYKMKLTPGYDPLFSLRNLRRIN